MVPTCNTAFPTCMGNLLNHRIRTLKQGYMYIYSVTMYMYSWTFVFLIVVFVVFSVLMSVIQLSYLALNLSLFLFSLCLFIIFPLLIFNLTILFWWQTVYVYGFQIHFAGVDRPQFLPPSIEGLGVWFGITAFLFCVHSMVRACDWVTNIIVSEKRFII